MNAPVGVAVAGTVGATVTGGVVGGPSCSVGLLRPVDNSK
jgi:hypothetical protein